MGVCLKFGLDMNDRDTGHGNRLIFCLHWKTISVHITKKIDEERAGPLSSVTCSLKKENDDHDY